THLLPGFPGRTRVDRRTLPRAGRRAGKFARPGRAGLARWRTPANGKTMNQETEIDDRNVESEHSGDGTPEAGLAPSPGAGGGSPTPEVATTGAEKLAEVMVVASGKGGVGKTTSSASIAVGLARRG